VKSPTTDQDLWAAFAGPTQGAQFVSGDLDLALAKRPRPKRTRAKTAVCYVRRVRTAVRPRERRAASGRSSARSGDSPDDPSSSEPHLPSGGGA